MSSNPVLAIVVLVAISAFLSSSEIALFSLSRVQLRLLRERLRGRYRQIKRLLGDPGGLLITILVINEVVNVSLSNIFTGIAARNPEWFRDSLGTLPHWLRDTIVSTALTTPLILIFCEITPKIIGARANELIATISSRPLAIVYLAFAPIRALIKIFLKNTPGIGDRDAVLKESEFMMLLEEGRKEGAVNENEVELIRNVFEMDDMTVEGILTPLGRVAAIPSHLLLKDALHFARMHPYSRIPVFQGQKKNIVGVLYAKDLLKVKADPSLGALPASELMRKPVIVAHSTRLSTVFRRFKQQKTHLAFVQNGGQNIVGIVTLNDVIQSLFEEILEGDNAT